MATLRGFFDLLGPERSAAIELVSADAADWITDVVRERCPRAVLCLDPFHVVSWATDALDEVRREVWNVARRGGQHSVARELKGARFALWKNPGDLTDRQETKLALIERTNQRLYRAHLLKEPLREVFHLPHRKAMAPLDDWLIRARRCRLPSFVKLARSITARRADIAASLRQALSNARVESIDTELRLLTRLAFGFRSSDALIALPLLSLGGLCPPLPGRS